MPVQGQRGRVTSHVKFTEIALFFFEMPIDIRDRPRLSHSDILELNFIRNASPFVFRRHYRAGLRSHIMALLRPEDLRKEQDGVLKEGVRRFPKARPMKMLRIFRTRFDRLKDAEDELRRVKVVEKHLAPEYLAKSNEFLVDYALGEHHDLLLCGLQEYVEGETLDPWGPLDRRTLWALFCRMNDRHTMPAGSGKSRMDNWYEKVREGAERFIIAIRNMITEAFLIPDLAGVGNLILMPTGGIRLVDINNISVVSCEGDIFCDEKGYPVCDKSVEALVMMERKLLARSLDQTDPVCGGFLDPVRIKKVQAIEKRFHRSRGTDGSFYPIC